MDSKAKLSWLLLVLSCTVRCVCAKDAATSLTPTKMPATTPAMPIASISTIPSAAQTSKPPTASTLAPPITEKSTITVPSITTTPPQPTISITVKTIAPTLVATAQKSSTPSSGGNTVQQSVSTVSKIDKTTLQTPSKSPEQSPPSKANTSTMGSTAPPTQAPPPGQALTQKTAPTDPAQSPTPKDSVTPENKGTGVNFTVTEAPGKMNKASTALIRGTTTKQDNKGAAETTAAVTSKPTPDQAMSSPTASPETTPSQSSSKAPTTSTHGKSGPDPVHLSTTESKVPIGVQTSLPSTTIASKTGPETFNYSLKIEEKSEKEPHLVSLCKQLIVDLEDGQCILTVKYPGKDGKPEVESAAISGKVKTKIVAQQYEDIIKQQKTTDNRTLITILASCGALLIMIIILAVCASHHKKPYNENQQHLTDELQTVENGYHDNPTLEVMEVQAVEPEKKLNLNGEFNDSWIVPMDNLLKEEGPDEEDTHL